MKKLFFLIGMLLLASVTYAQQPDFNTQTKTIAHWEQKENAWRVKHHAAERNAAANNYNLVYDRCQWNVDPAVYYLSGEVTSFFIPVSGDLSQMELDFSGAMTVDSVKFHHASVSFTHSDDVLVISFPSSIGNGILDSVSVYYQGAPVGTGFGSFVQYTHNNVPVIWTLSEPYGAKDWWPCKQSLNDKIDSIDIYVTCPQGNRVGSNGILISEIQNGSNKTFHWKSRYPIAAYLVAMAVTNYAQYSDYAILSNGDSLQILNYVYPEDLATAQAATAAIVPVIHLYDSLITDYPFAKEKFGHCEFSWGGGMEHQTMTYCSLFDEWVIAHECAHQWFGDKVTLGSWQDIWLNEGFATYFEGLTQQNLYPANWDSWKQQQISSIVSDPGGSVFCTDTTDIGRIFDSRLTYSKGAYLLHMLRWKLGDANFFSALRQYQADVNHAYKYARTADLKQYLESVSGQDLTAFFNQWYYGQGYPSYNLRWYTAGKTFGVTIKQTQSNVSVSCFQMPVPLELKDATHDTTVVLNNTANSQVFSLRLSFTPTQVILDPKMWIIHANDVVTRFDTTLIITNIISGSPFCPNAHVNVPFDAGGTYLAGNIFTAQISNASGSFSSPASIGTLSSTTNSGTISATLPVSLAAGAGYRIRVVSSKPIVTGSANTSNLSVNGCAVPSGLNATNITKTSAVINWTAVNCAYNYKLQYRKSGTSNWTTVTITSGVSYTITGLVTKTAYDYHVQTTCTSDGSSSSAYSATQTFTTINKREEPADESIVTLNDVTVYPNPAKDDFTVAISSEQSVTATVSIYNAVGSQLLNEDVSLSEGVNTISFESALLTAGIYLVVVQVPEEKMIRRLTVAK